MPPRCSTTGDRAAARRPRFWVDVEFVASGAPNATTDPDDVAAPVNVDGCAHGAWANAQLYLLACENRQPAVQDIDQPTAGNRLGFRVNRGIVAEQPQRRQRVAAE